MTKVGIVTIESMNYGNRLQNYALQEILKTMNCNVSTFHRGEKPSLKISIKRRLKTFLQRTVRTKGGLFSEFDKKIRWDKRYISADNAPANIENEYDFFVTGSDQVWNPYYDFVGQADLLYFAKPEQRISYAASFGVTKIPEGKKNLYTQNLNKFSGISVREQEGLEIVTELSDKFAELVLDPTLLLDMDEWRKLEKRPRIDLLQNYILVYALGQKNDIFNKTIERLKREGQTIFDVRMVGQNGREVAVGPSEFLYLIDHADYVLTDSFHATAFSLIFHKKVKTFNREGIDMSSRITSLANSINLSRNIDKDGTFCVEQQVDFFEIDKSLNKRRVQSRKFLENNIKNVGRGRTE